MKLPAPALILLKPVLDRLDASPIGKRIAGGMFWSLLGTVIAKGFAWMSLVLVARLLGKEMFGEFGFVRNTAMALVAFSGAGMGLTVMKHIPELLESDKERIGRIIGLCYLFTVFTALLTAVAFFAAAPWLCEVYFGKPHLLVAMRLGAAILFASTCMTVQIAIMIGFQDFRGLATATLVTGLSTPFAYGLGALYYGMEGAIFGVLIVVLLNLATNSVMIYRNVRGHRIRYRFLEAYKELPLLWQSNLPLFFSNVFYAFSLWLTQAMLNRMPGGAEELGSYYAAYNYQLIGLFLFQQLAMVIFPVMSELSGKENTARYWSLVKKGTLLGTAFSAFVVLPFMLFPGFFMELNGQEFAKDWNVLVFASCGVIVYAATALAATVLITRGRNWAHFVLTLISMSLYIAAAVVCFRLQFGGGSLFIAYMLAQTVYALGVCCIMFVNRRGRAANET